MSASADILGVSETTGWPTTRILPSPSDPMRVARELVDAAGLAETILWWCGDFYRWTGTHWQVWSDAAVIGWLYENTEHAQFSGEKGLAQWAPTRKKLGDLKDALGLGVVQRAEHLPPDDGLGEVAFTNGVLDLKTMTLQEHASSRFNLHVLAVDYAADAECPRWLRFLGEILESDADRISVLQEWFGYLLCGGTELQKILSMFGPKRCGKGTVLRVLTALLGQRYVASVSTLDSLAGPFGLQKLIGVRLAVIGDVQWSGSNLAEVVGILLGISGEDHPDIARKNRTDWRGKLQVRFALAGNDQPKFSNTSGALAGRMEHLQFRVSFYGREDPRLTEKLLSELAGIFNWALAGWRRLQDQDGRFTRGLLGQKVADEVERNSSPVTAFVRDTCVLEANARVSQDALLLAYRNWREEEGMEGTITKPSFARNLLSAYPQITTGREGSSRTTRTRFAVGIRLRRHDEEEIADPADPADPARLFDHPASVSAGQSTSGPGGPGGPGKSGENQSHAETSAERMSCGDVEAKIGNLPGPSGSAGSTPHLSSAYAGPGMHDVPGPSGSGWSDMWDGVDLANVPPEEAA